MAILHRELVDIPLPSLPSLPSGTLGSVRALIARPKNVIGRLPAILVWPDIFQLTPSHVRVVERIAGHGFVVIAPEIYARIEPPGSALDFDRDRQRALDDAAKVELSWIDQERRAVIDFAASRPEIDPSRLGACGFCFGGHLAFRAALEPEIKTTVCFYATGVHGGDLGASKGTAGTLARASEIRGSLVLHWGAQDPHIPAAGRGVIHRALEDANVAYEIRLFDAAHAFVRDVGERYDPEAADRALRETISHFHRVLLTLWRSAEKRAMAHVCHLFVALSRAHALRSRGCSPISSVLRCSRSRAGWRRSRGVDPTTTPRLRTGATRSIPS